MLKLGVFPIPRKSSKTIPKLLKNYSVFQKLLQNYSKTTQKLLRVKKTTPITTPKLFQNTRRKKTTQTTTPNLLPNTRCILNYSKTTPCQLVVPETTQWLFPNYSVYFKLLKNYSKTTPQTDILDMVGVARGDGEHHKQLRHTSPWRPIARPNEPLTWRLDLCDSMIYWPP